MGRKDAASAPVTGPARTLLAANLTATMGLGPLPLFAVGALAPLLTEEFGLSRTELGLLTPFGFAVAAVGAYLGGHLPDRVGPRRILVALYAASLTAVLVFAAAQSFATLVTVMVLAGAAMSLSNPVTNSLIGRLVEPGTRGGMMGIKQSGVPMAQFLAGVSLPVGAAVWGWRGVLAAVAVLPVAGIVLSLRTLPEDPVTGKVSAARPKATLSRGVWILSLYSFLVAIVLQAVGVYASLYAYEQVGLGATAAGTVVGVFGGVGIVARLLWGRIAEHRPTVSGPLLLLAGLGAVSLAGFLAAEHVGGWLLWGSAVAFGASAVSVNVVVMLATFRVAKPENTGQATGVIMLGMYSGFVIGPPAFGALTDLLGEYTVAWISAIGVCVVAMGVAAWLRARGE